MWRDEKIAYPSAPRHLDRHQRQDLHRRLSQQVENDHGHHRHRGQDVPRRERLRRLSRQDAARGARPRGQSLANINKPLEVSSAPHRVVPISVCRP